MNIQCCGGPRTFEKEMRASKMRTLVAGLYQSEVDNDSWEPLLKLMLLQLHQKLPKNSVSTILWSFGIWSKLKRVKKLDKWVPRELTGNPKKSLLWCVIFFYFVQELQTLSWSNCDMWQKWIVYDSWWWPAQCLDWEEAPEHVPKTNLHQKRSWSLFGGLLSVWSTTAFWIPAKPLHLRSMPSRSMRYTKNCNISCHRLSIERASSSPWQCLTIGHTTNASKIEWIGLQSLASPSIFTSLLTNWLPLVQASW